MAARISPLRPRGRGESGAGAGLWSDVQLCRRPDTGLIPTQRDFHHRGQQFHRDAIEVNARADGLGSGFAPAICSRSVNPRITLW